MDRASIFYLNENDSNTYDFDETLPSLPLPELHETMERYYESLTPFGTPEELDKSRQIIAKFEKGIGAELQAKLKQRAAIKKNWCDEWWDKYAYHMLRTPLNPYIVMSMPVNLESVGIPETPERLLKNLARIMYYTVEFWDLLHKAKIRALSSNGGKIKYSSALYKNFFSTTRVPGEEFDHIERHFKTADEGKTPTHGLISGKGRLFIFNCVHTDGTLLTQQEIYVLLQRLRTILDYEPAGDGVPVLTHDDRTMWAKNRSRLLEISPANKDILKLIETASVVIAFDENEPKDLEEVSWVSVNGDYHSKWGDRSSTVIAYKSGKFAYVGEHSAYDGTVSVSYAIYVQMSMYEIPEPDWSNIGNEDMLAVGLKELKFDLNSAIRKEIARVMKDCDQRRNDVLISYAIFEEYGKDFIKECKLHPDSFVQVIMQLAYAQMHNDIAPTYETALMRHYYNGRTETLRSCTTKVHEFIQIARNPSSSNAQIVKAFRNAVQHHNHMMNEARKGHGVDRHIFGLWCAAYESGLNIPDFYDDPLYVKSGGGGNFVLSTSTLGYSINVGFVAPMTLDGYGVFYTITEQAIFIQVSAFRGSIKSSAYKFSDIFKDTLTNIKRLWDAAKDSKL